MIAEVSGFVIRGASGGKKSYLSSGLYWFADDIDDAWIFEALPDASAWETKPVEFASADVVDDGVIRTGPWVPWEAE